MSSWIFSIQRYKRKILSMRTNVVLPVWIPPPEVRPAAELSLIHFNNAYQLPYSLAEVCGLMSALLVDTFHYQTQLC